MLAAARIIKLMSWYKQTVESVYQKLNTSEEGLTTHEAHERIKEYGLNQLKQKKEPLWKIIIEPFRSAFELILVLAAVVSFVTGHHLDGFIIIAIILVDIGIFYSQQYATQRVLRSLKKHSESHTVVIRDGNEMSVWSSQLVPGDIVLLSEGDRVPADGRVIDDDVVQMNEAALTGESTPVQKDSIALTEDKQIYEQDNMVFEGTYVLSGRARMVAVATGSNTEFGKIADLASVEQSKSPVQERIDHLIGWLAKAIVVVAVLVFILSLLRGMPLDETIRFVLSLSVSAVPEGLPVAMTVIIVIGMRRMAKKKALVRSFKAIEDVGLITTIATDKTGTLTKNRLTVVDSWSAGDEDAVDFIQKTIDMSERQSDPLDQAVLDSAPKRLPAPDEMYPFDLSLRMSGAYDKRQKVIYIKGSPEHVLALAKPSVSLKKKTEEAMHAMASKGFRIIAVAKAKDINKAPESLVGLKSSVEFIGLVGFADELRLGIESAVRTAHRAGINVKLITGDHYETAMHIGQEVGIAAHDSEVIAGYDLPKETRAFDAAVREHTVFARILPDDKYKILQSLKKTEITAMTGDGVNDVPALANAHVGFSMGSGNDIARDAGDVVLLKDSFATIMAAVAEGRKIYDNIRRMIFYLIATSLGEVLTMVGALIFGLPLPVTAIQILWINLVTDTAMVLPLGLEPAEKDLMKRPPRHPKSPLFGKALMSRMLIIAGVMAGLTLIAVFVLHRQGQELAYIQTVAFTMLIVAQWANAINARSEKESSFRRFRTRNRGLLIGFGVALGLQLLVMFGPLQSAFGIHAVPLSVLGFWSALIAGAVLIVGEVHKFVTRRWFSSEKYQ